ncbi:MAG: D-glycero-beta-D-manno-heptose-1,7-bisphosphate 7-phosphatase [Candidatus Omnitrophica bacterium CG08_land_8_20_14_0_20_41_16]|uniref:D,D-heptose 1,7-bisphosphate phosphatase n=1 Tax=Candidatus Sherwoodlollariibacterium unditelluris TaxID=1974757 RepID=A0A2G9YJW8_9BACT|nr:MAG: D-glycero-beta-D-manno-heptose-1,7-bisphosphate 7-phosphatase [Candidatus Omnitrophica bacterium CG23_combo_of_CG06-09_8_20_14_all_41_10]PIS33460.1 MAG: D-glycero-beta-D-manno-heptose-1,7-bisphosphate 7-phosphatase [Candidatus Omnitrophica bacterium CG08_land_8_20_14_0_20_41_16]
MKVIFLDRDGVINKYPGDGLYVTSLKKFKFLPGVKKAIALLGRAGFKIFVASNQAGVGKGIYSQRALDNITAKMLGDIERSGGRITKVYYCAHRKDAGCNCRKPKPGMLKKAAKEFKFNLKNAYFVGDTIRDVFTAKNAGCKPILVLSGKEKIEDKKSRAGLNLPYYHIFKDLKEAAKFIIAKN